MESKPRYKNVVLVGTTGNGKSSTGNTLAGMEAFVTSDKTTSCTATICPWDIERLLMRIIDTPGFGDTNFDSATIDQIIKGLTANVVDPFGKTTNQIDAFLLVEKGAPRLNTIARDIEKMMDLFGPIALKSTIIVIIHATEPVPTDEERFTELSQMTNTMKAISLAKKEPFNKKWFVLWDNKRPRTGQLEDLLEKINKVEPYTHQKFLEAQEEIKKRLNAAIQAEVEKERKFIEKLYKDDKEAMKKEMELMEKRHKEEKKQIEESLARAANNTKEIVEALNKANREQSEKMLEHLREERKANEERQLKLISSLQEQMSKNEKASAESMAALRDSTAAMMNSNMEMMKQLIEAEKNRQPQVVYVPQGGGGGGVCLLL